MPEDRYKKRERQARWYRNNRLAAIELLGGKCVVCGTTEELEVDHVDPLEKASSNIWSWSKARRLEELKKCQVLCTTHHGIKTREYAALPTTAPHYKGHNKGCACQGCKSMRSLEAAEMLRRRYEGVPVSDEESHRRNAVHSGKRINENEVWEAS